MNHFALLFLYIFVINRNILAADHYSVSMEKMLHASVKKKAQVVQMRIKKIQTGIIHIPLQHPFKTALRTVESVEDVIVRIETDTGEEGFGEAPPTAVITGDILESVEGAIKNFISPSLEGMEIENMDGIMKKLHGCIKGNTSAKAAVDMAIFDLYGKSMGRPLYRLLGGARDELTTDLTISVNSIPQMVQDSLQAIKDGFHILKIKVGKEGYKDVERIREIRQAIGPEVVIRVDANQGWTPKESVRMIQKMEDLGLNIDLVEQPVSAENFEGMKFVTSRVSTRILADETVFSPKQAIRVIEEHAADMINIKLMKTGGIYEALKIINIAEIYGIECMIGCMLESKIAVSAAAHLAAGKSIITAVDLDGPSLCKEDPYEGGPLYKGEKITMPKEAGIGILKVPVSFR